MTYYQKKLERHLWHELKHLYPELAPPDERTPEQRKRDAEQDIVDLFGPEEKEGSENHADQGTD